MRSLCLVSTFVFYSPCEILSSLRQADSKTTTNRIHELEKPIILTPFPNPSLQVTADHKLKQVEAPVREPGLGEVLLHIKATGVCG